MVTVTASRYPQAGDLEIAAGTVHALELLCDDLNVKDVGHRVMGRKSDAPCDVVGSTPLLPRHGMPFLSVSPGAFLFG